MTPTLATRAQNSLRVKAPLETMTNESMALVQFLMDTCPNDKYPLSQYFRIGIPGSLCCQISTGQRESVKLPSSLRRLRKCLWATVPTFYQLALEHVPVMRMARNSLEEVQEFPGGRRKV